MGVKWRPDPSELAEFGPKFEEVWDSHYANAPDKPVLWMGIVSRCVCRFHSCSIVTEIIICVAGGYLRLRRIQVGRRSDCCTAAQIFHADLHDGEYNGPPPVPSTPGNNPPCPSSHPGIPRRTRSRTHHACRGRLGPTRLCPQIP